MADWLQIDAAVRGHALRLRSDAPFVGVSGPSGSGKSTLLRLIAGLERRATGRIEVFGEGWLDRARIAPVWERRVGWVPQDAVLFPHLTVRENLAYAGRGVDGAVVGWLGIAHLLDRAPRHLSGGERQRVALGRALCTSPRLLLLDEPFAALDRALRGALAPRVAEWAAARGVKVVLVSHDEADLAAFGAERWGFADGHLQRTVESS